MKAPDSFRNPGFWCDFHQDHGHKTEDCVALKIEVNELLKKGYLSVGVKNGHDEVNIQISVKIGMNAFTKSNLLKDIFTKNFAVKYCTNLGSFIETKHS